MPDPLLLPSIAILSGGGLLAARDYLKRRFVGTEDRYMALYGKDQWSASNMDLSIHCAANMDRQLKTAFLRRLAEQLASALPARDVWLEEADLSKDELTFFRLEAISIDALCRPRPGLYLDLEEKGHIRVVWNHMQFDGVGVWNALRPLFDENPPLLTYDGGQKPPPILPELLALPAVAQRLVWRGRLAKETPEGGALSRGLAVWDAAKLRALKERFGGSFNLLTAALAVRAVFERHPDKASLNAGLTAYFPFMEGRNKYGLVLCRVNRGSTEAILSALTKQTKNKLVGWGASSAQAYALGRIPERAFAKLVSMYRRKIDVLISSLPVGTEPIRLDSIPTVISCHPWELTLPYYFLLVGTRAELHASFTSRYPQEADLLDLDRLAP